uniref:Mu-thomitoxin-Hme1c n=1 Tax=Heriaeus mellotteei TaxID=2337432 RepID=TXHM3_HERML|nr:RecName: Full=Mu-thomitoxin-Hme1c; Short=Mu-TMTX-Hme1c; AltName: Full=Neurotoxin Hm-3 [Heriaeus mellotteei]2MQU_A Chain A, Neurotoxin Hm-3 [Heriaeus mellotteei]
GCIAKNKECAWFSGEWCCGALSCKYSIKRNLKICV